MKKPEKVYRDVIMTIDGIRDSKNERGPFAIWEIVEATHYSSTQIARILKRLMYMDLVFKLRTGFNNRFYKATWHGKSVLQVIEQYDGNGINADIYVIGARDTISRTVDVKDPRQF